MSKPKSPAVSFYDGAIIRKNAIFLCGKLDMLEYDDYSHSRNFILGANNSWGGDDLPFMTTSVCVYRPKDPVPAERAMCTLAQMAGCVDFYWARGVKTGIEQLPGAQQQGGLLHLMQIKQAGNDLFVVGADSQVYRRINGVWEIYSQGLEGVPVDQFLKQGKSLGEAVTLSGASTVDLYSIDGSNFDNLYAVGRDGAICYRDADAWRRLEQVTNVKLHRVKYVDDDHIYIGGDKGMLLQGNRKGFQVIQTGIGDDLWGLEWFNDRLYIGTKTQGIYEFDGKVCHRVKTTPKGDFECHTLNAYDGQLLAVGSKDILLTEDCINWRVIDHPDNQ